MIPLTLLILILLIGLTLLLSGLFSGTETAFYLLDKPRWMAAGSSGATLAKGVVWWLRRPVEFLTVILVGNTIANIACSSLIAVVLRMGEVEDQWGAIFAPMVILIGGEIIPKVAGISLKERWAALGAIVLTGVRFSFYPLIWVISREANRFLRWMNITLDQWRITRHDVQRYLVREMGEGRRGRVGMIERALEVRDKVVGDIMTPRVRVVAMPASSSLYELRRKFSEIPYQRVLIYGRDLDDPLGYVHCRDLLARLSQGEAAGEKAETIMKPLPLVPESMNVLALPLWMRTQGVDFAAVLDQYGGLAGVVSLEDLGEELVGSILEESGRAIVGCLRLGRNSYVVRGDIRLSLLETALEAELPPVEARTLNGFLTELNGKRLPQTGDEFQVGNLRIRVIAAHQRGAQLVRVEKLT